MPPAVVFFEDPEVHTFDRTYDDWPGAVGGENWEEELLIPGRMVYVGQGVSQFTRIDEPDPGVMFPKRRRKKKKKGTSTPPPPPPPAPALTPAPIDWEDWEELCQAAPPLPPLPPPEIWEPEDWDAEIAASQWEPEDWDAEIAASQWEPEDWESESPHHGSLRIGMQRLLHPSKNSPFQGYGRFYGHPTSYEKTLSISMQKENTSHSMITHDEF
jgi:hypothetical protein